MTPAAGAAVASARNAILRWPRADARNWLAAFLKRAQRDPNVAAVIAVGSAGIYPASRPELPGQLRDMGDADLAARLEAALAKR